MRQEQIAGILLCVSGLLLSAKPTDIWKLTERWKTEKGSVPSAAYLTVMRIVSGAFLGVGVLLVAGIIK